MSVLLMKIQKHTENTTLIFNLLYGLAYIHTYTQCIFLGYKI